MYKTRAFASEAPYSDAFVVDTRWMFEQIEEGKVRMRVFVDIIFIKSCWVKSMNKYYIMKEIEENKGEERVMLSAVRV